MATINKPVDVVIVGFGWTGAIMAIELAKTGLNVLALERGGDAATVPNWAYPKVVDEIAQSARNGLLQNLSKSTVTIRHSKNDRALPYRQIGSFKPGTGVGGAGIHWSGVHSRVMPQELRLKSHITERYGKHFIPGDMTLQDWGISFEELEPHFDRFEAVCGTSGKAGNIQGRMLEGGNPFEAPRSHEFPLPPLTDPPTSALFAKATRDLGYHP
jgi:gluconate 2-dehydrogenase alpha chain